MGVGILALTLITLLKFALKSDTLSRISNLHNMSTHGLLGICFYMQNVQFLNNSILFIFNVEFDHGFSAAAVDSQKLITVTKFHLILLKAVIYS